MNTEVHLKIIANFMAFETVPKTPQQNGVAKRMNMTCMLSHSKLLKSFWGEAMRTSIDLINLSPSVPLKGDVLERVWKGKMFHMTI